MGANGKPANDNGRVSSVARKPVIRLIVADTQAIFRVGVRKVLALEEDIQIIAQPEDMNQTLEAVAHLPAHVLMFDTRMSMNGAEAVTEILNRSPGLKIVIPGDFNEAQTVEYLRRGVKGFVSRAIAPELLVRCVRKTAEGETWLDNQGVNWVIDAYRTQASASPMPRSKVRLTEKEMLIVSCVTQGMKNKDIAREVGTTEQVIKNYLRRVYDKLGVSDRLELALYCVQHRLLEGFHRRPVQKAVPADAKPEVATGTTVASD